MKRSFIIKALIGYLMSPCSFVGASTTQFERDTYRVAEAIYFEARGEAIEGWRAIGHVILNRYYDKRWPKTIEAVILQPARSGKSGKHRCQFSYQCDGLPETIANKEVFSKILIVAKQILLRCSYDITKGSNIYVRCDVAHKNSWLTNAEFVRKIGQHCFYKE